MNKFYFIFGEGSKVNQVLCALLINLPVFAYGASIGWMSPMTHLLQSENSPRGAPLTDIEVSWMAAVSYLVCVPCDFLMANIGDKIGRKLTLLFMSSTCVLCWLIKLSSFEPWALVLARALVGLSMAGSYVTCPLYTKEISEDSIRGLLGTFVIIFHTSGNLFSFIIGDLLCYNTILWICLSIPVIHILLFISMPESPSFLVKKGKHEQAAKALAWLRCRSPDDRSILHELDMFKKEQENDEGGNKFLLKAIVTDKIQFRAFRICMFVAIARELCGAIPVLNYAAHIFHDASQGTSLNLSPNQQAILLGLVQVFGSLLACCVVEKSGRKLLLLVTAIASGVSMCILGSWFWAREYSIITPAWIPILTLCLCIFCDSLGFQPVSVLITGEIFSFKYRGTVFAAAMATASLADFIQMLIFRPLANIIGVHYLFIFFGTFCLLAAVYIALVIPETKKKSLTEIYQALKTKKERELEMKELNVSANKVEA